MPADVKPALDNMVEARRRGPDSQAAVFLLGDQPHAPPELVIALVETHARTRAAVVAPLIYGHRGNPIL
jgi:molybdenum cofactor cytidylyltransferase